MAFLSFVKSLGDSVLLHSKAFTFFNVFFLVLSIAFSLLFVFVGMGNEQDLTYWILLFPDYKNQAMTAGTLWLGNIWTNCFGLSILSVRILSWLTHIGTFALIFLCLIPRQKWIVSLPFLSYSLMLTGNALNSFEFGPSQMTILLLSALCVFFIKWLQTDHRQFLLLCAILSAFAIACRFPNILCVLVTDFLITMATIAKKRKIVSWLVDVSLYSFITFVAYYLVLSSLLGTFDILGALVGHVSHASTGSHTFASMIHGLYSDYSQLIGYVGFSFLLLAFSRVYLRLDSTSLKVSCVLIQLFLFIPFFANTIGFHKWGNTFLAYFLSAFTISSILWGTIENMSHNHFEEVLPLVSVVLFCVVAPMGSDTRWLKLFPIFVLFLPVFCSQLFSMHLISKYMIPLMAILLLFSVRCYVVNPLNISTRSIPIWDNSERIKEERLKGIYILPQEKQRYVEYRSVYNRFAQRGNVAVYGSDSYPFVFLNEERNKAHDAFRTDYENVSFIAINEELLIREQPTVFIVKPFKEESPFGKMLHGQGYEMVHESSDLYVYSKVETNNE